MPLTGDEALNLVLALARRVRTQEGVRIYNKPIGSLIGEGGDDSGSPEARKAPVPSSPVARPGTPDGEKVETVDDPGQSGSLVRVRSLMRQMKKAIKQGDDSQADLINKQLRDEIKAYAKGKDMAVVMQKVEGIEP